MKHIAMNAARLAAVLLSATALPAAHARTLYWGGGETDIADGTPLPEDVASLSGTWDLTTKNWSVDPEGTEYVAWENGAEMAAVLSPFVESDGEAFVTLLQSVVLNRIDVPHDHPNASGWNHAYKLKADAPVTLTLAGKNPRINVAANNPTRQFFVQANVELIALEGFTKGMGGTLYVESVSDQVLGTVVILGAWDNGMRIDQNASMKGVTEFVVMPESRLGIQLNQWGANTVINDNAMIRMRGGILTSDHNWDRAQTFSQLNLDSSGALRFAWGNAEFRVTHPAQGVVRGVDGKGTLMVVGNGAADTLGPSFVVEEGVQLGEVLPWAWTVHSRPLMFNSLTKALEVVPVDSAPEDLTAWVANSSYRLEEWYAPFNTLGSIDIESLGLFCAPMTLAIGEGETLNILSGHLSLNHYEQDGARVITGGSITTPADALYILCGSTGNATALSIESALTGSMDVVKSGFHNVFIAGTATNTYTGTTYVNHGTLYIGKAHNVTAIPGDAVVNYPGTLWFQNTNMQATNGNLTVREGGRVFFNDGASQQFYGVVTLWNGSFLHGAEGGGIYFSNPGAGLVFADGGTLRHDRADRRMPLHLFTDVQCGPDATNRAVIATDMPVGWETQCMMLSHTSHAQPVTRTFDVRASLMLPPEIPELLVSTPFETANNVPVTIRKTGAGAMEVDKFSGRFRGAVEVLDGELWVNGPYTTQSVMTVTTFDGYSSFLGGIASTAGLLPLQPTDLYIDGAGNCNWVTRIVDEHSIWITDWPWAAPGSGDCTFLACGALGVADVLVSGAGVLRGTGGVGGSVKVGEGGVFKPGTPAEPEGSLFIGKNLDFSEGGSWQVDIVDTETCNTAHITGNIILGGAVNPVFSAGVKKTPGNWVIATYEGGTVAGSMAAPAGFKVYANETAKTVHLRYNGGGTLFLLR